MIMTKIENIVYDFALFAKRSPEELTALQNRFKRRRILG